MPVRSKNLGEAQVKQLFVADPLHDKQVSSQQKLGEVFKFKCLPAGQVKH